MNKVKDIEMCNSEWLKRDLEVSFNQICEKCKTVGELQKLDKKLKELNSEI